ncbi:MAG TPA: cytochrome c peroxidase, partial [Gemmatimonadales bacterium]|nr:cytochrome c peroxidase [Gemmatimonadales bacterium]
CATCHHPSRALGDGLSLAIGTGGSGAGSSRTLGAGRQFDPRRAPSLLNKGLGLQWIFWDGRVSSFQPGVVTGPPGVPIPGGLPNALTAQAMLPVLDRVEMRGAPGDVDVLGAPNELAQFNDSDATSVWQALMRRLLAIPEYGAMFQAAVPGPTNLLNFSDAARAIAAFEMQASTKMRSPFDRYLDRDDAALTIEEKRGALLFFGKGRCVQCHNGPLLGANGFVDAAVPQIGPGLGAAAPLDLGRGNLPNNDSYKFAFRVAPLRNVELTAPYMHDGAFPTLEAVVRHYNDPVTVLRSYDTTQLAQALRPLYHGDDATINAVLGRLDFRLRPLGLTAAEESTLVTFLRALTDPAARDLGALVPARVPSGLAVPR